MIGNRSTARRALPSPGTVHTTLERDHPFSRTVQTRERHSRPRAIPLPSPAGAIGSNGSLPASWGTAPPAADRLRSRPAGSVADDLTASGKKLCVDSGLASFGAFCGARHSCGIGSPRSRSPAPQPPDVPAILGAWGGGVDAPWRRSQHSWDIDSLLSPSPQPIGCVELAMTHRSASRCVLATHPTCLLVPSSRIVLFVLFVLLTLSFFERCANSWATTKYEPLSIGSCKLFICQKLNAPNFRR